MNKITAASMTTFVAALLLSACAPASLGSPPASERNRDCVAGETLVCRNRYPSKLGDEDQTDGKFCTCENINTGLRL